MVKTHLLHLETLLKAPYVQPDYWFDLSLDGQQVAFSYKPSGQWEICLMPLDGSTPPQQITTGPESKLAPGWSPDGQGLAYVLDLGGAGPRYFGFDIDYVPIEDHTRRADF